MIYVIIIIVIVVFIFSSRDEKGNNASNISTRELNNIKNEARQTAIEEKKICDKLGNSSEKYGYDGVKCSVEELSRIYAKDAYSVRKKLLGTYIIFNDKIRLIDYDSEADVPYISLGDGGSYSYGNGKCVKEEVRVYLEPVLLEQWLGCISAGDIITVIGVLDEVSDRGFDLVGSIVVTINGEISGWTRRLMEGL